MLDKYSVGPEAIMTFKETEHKGGLRIIKVPDLLLTQQPRDQFPAFPNFFHRKKYQCRQGSSTAHVIGKWTVAYKC